MSRFGEGTGPTTIEELLGGGLMSRLDRLDVLSRKVFSGKVHGERRSRRRGQSVDFADYRPYTAGDDLRFVDWNIYARLESLFLKLFLEEEDLSLAENFDAAMQIRERFLRIEDLRKWHEEALDWHRKRARQARKDPDILAMLDKLQQEQTA